MQLVQLTKDFSADEFDTARAPWPAGKDANRAQLAALAQWLRDLAGSAGYITSASRSDADNAHVGGSESSQHKKQEAVDLVYPFAPLRLLAERALAEIKAGRAPAFGQLIFYVRAGHVHVSLPTLGARNGEMLVADDTGPATRYAQLTRADQLPALSASQSNAASIVGVLAVVGGALIALHVSGE